jgi:hypothetical protein
MDQLQLDLWWRGLNIAQDAGTYLYNAAFPWNNALVSTRVHNTVMVDGRDQMTRGGVFLTLDWFPAYSRNLIDSDNRVMRKVLARHAGYRGVRHERIVTVDSTDRWRVEDRLLSRREHTYRLQWLLPDWEWKLESADKSILLSLHSPFGWVSIQLETVPPLPALETRVSLVRAGELVQGMRECFPFEGWVSPTYGTKSPALSVVCELRARGHHAFVTKFRFPE